MLQAMELEPLWRFMGIKGTMILFNTDIPIKNIFANTDISKEAYVEKSGGVKLQDSDFLNDMEYEAMEAVIAHLEKIGAGEGTINYRLRDAIFSQ